MVTQLTPAVDGVDGVGNHHYLNLRALVLAGQQGVAQGHRYLTMAFVAVIGGVVKLENIQYYKLFGLSDQAQYLIENLLPAEALAVCIDKGLVEQQSWCDRRTPIALDA